jgi:allantoinase
VELAAIRLAIEFAGETGCALHVVHVSSPEGIALITEARAQRVDVTAETCSHYLLLNEKDVAKLGAASKCAPPIRDEKRRVALWSDLRAGRIHTVGSDHSPAPPEMKTSKNFFEIWGGIGGVQGLAIGVLVAGGMEAHSATAGVLVWTGVALGTQIVWGMWQYWFLRKSIKRWQAEDAAAAPDVAPGGPVASSS